MRFYFLQWNYADDDDDENENAHRQKLGARDDKVENEDEQQDTL